MRLQDDYNTQRNKMMVAEYGRHIQEYIDHIRKQSVKEQRTKWAHALVNVMATLNPEVRQQSNYREKLWGHLYQIANFDLDVDCPFTVPQPEARNKKPDTIGYPDSKIKFRFYGRNLQNMVDKVADMEPGEMKQDLVNLIASFMFNSCKSWNNENLSNDVIAEHLNVLSKGKLSIGGGDLVVSPDNSPVQQQQRRYFKKQGNNQGGKKNRFNRPGNKGGFRRF
jgi:hypothetical protein